MGGVVKKLDLDAIANDFLGITPMLYIRSLDFYSGFRLKSTDFVDVDIEQ